MIADTGDSMNPPLSLGVHVSIEPKPGFAPARGTVVAISDDRFTLLRDQSPDPSAPAVWTDEILFANCASISQEPARQTLIRVYRGKQQADTTEAFQKESALLAQAGYAPTSQSWAQGQWGCGAWLLAVVLMVLLVGILVFLYMLIVKPAGTLTVTYELRTSTAGHGQAVAEQPLETSSLAARLAQLDEARSANLITVDEYEARRRAMIDGF